MQRNILESIASRPILRQILDDCAVMIETMVPEALASVMLLDQRAELNFLPDPPFPAESYLLFQRHRAQS